MMKILLLRRMMSAKIRSNRGASLIFALLLFLVCTVIGSVVLAAGTASAGRMSKLGEADQRYYSVASAAQLLARELTDKEIRIIRTYTKTETTKYELKNDDTIKPSDDSPTTEEAWETRLIRRRTDEYGAYVKDVSGNYQYIEVKKKTENNKPFYDEDKRSFLSERAVNYLFGNTEGVPNNCNCEDAMGRSFSSSHSTESGQFKIEHTVDNDIVDNDILKIRGKYDVNEDGTIVLTLWDDTTGSQHFSLVVTLQPEFDEKESTSTENKPPAPNDEGVYESSIITTTIKEASVSWKLGSITKNGSDI